MGNGEAPADWGPFEVFDDLRKTPFRSRKWKQAHAVEVEDGGLLGFAAFKDLPISFEEDAQAEVQLNIQDLWVVPKRATRHADIGDVYGVGLEGEDEDSEDEDLEQPGEVTSSSSSDHGGDVSSVPVRDSPPPPLRALRAHLVTKGQWLLAIHRGNVGGALRGRT